MSDDEAQLRECVGDLPECARLARYGALLLEANRSFNLTGAKNVAECEEHLRDSVSIASYITKHFVDIGSGGGFPAIPLAIVTGMPVTMVETTLKKARFLEAMLEALALEGTVLAQRAEVVAQDARFRGAFERATARAVSSAPTVAELTLPLLAIGGEAILQRGTLETDERNALSDAAPMLGGVLDRVDRLSPDEPIRQVAVLRKIASTPPRFPRRVGVPEKRPLCFERR